MLTTTLNHIRACSPCASGWAKLLAGLGKTQADDDELPYADILRINGLSDALWACRCEPKYAREWRLLAVKYVRAMEHRLTDERSRTALDVAERYANGNATDAELELAHREALEAARAAAAAAAAAYAARAAAAAYYAAYVATAAYAASSSAAAYAVYAAARSADYAADYAAARADQERFFLEIVS